MISKTMVTCSSLTLIVGFTSNELKMASEQEERRIAKLEQRALEAESTIAQMKGYIELLNQRSGTCVC